jgi:arabinofuranosyltransferase
MWGSGLGMANGQGVLAQKELKEANANRLFLAVVFAFGLGLLSLNVFRERNFFHDDAFIELRYAKNLLAGAGLSWNPGERIEGFTSPLHVSLVSILGACGLDLPTAAHVVNFFALAVLIVCTGWAIERASTGSNFVLPRAAAWLVLASVLPLAVWVWGGLEAVLVACLVSAAQLPLLRVLPNKAISYRDPLLAGGALALATLARPDAAVLLAAAMGVYLVAGEVRLPQRLIFTCLLAAPTAAVMVAATAFREIYFGDIAPNTYYAKVYGVPVAHRILLGMQYVWGSEEALPPLLLVPLAALVHRPLMRRPEVFLLVAQVCACIAYVAWIGGDHMPYARFFVPLVPLLALLAFYVLAEPRARATVHGMAVLGTVVLTVTLAIATPPLQMDPAAFVGSIVGRYIGKEWPPGALVALNTAGSTPYYGPDLRYIDMLGLNDRVIARTRIERIVSTAQSWPGHAKGNGQYVLTRNPDFIIAGIAEGQSPESSPFIGDLELTHSAEFHSCYRRETAQIPYNRSYAAIGPLRPNPLIFTFYRRTCHSG